MPKLTIPQHRITISGNTTSGGAGTALISSGTLSLAGGNNVTLSQDGNAVTISGAAGGGAGFSGGVSTGGNTAGATGVTGTRLVFVGTNALSLSQTTDANGGTISFNVAAGGGAFSGGVSTIGNTAGSTGVSGTRQVLVGTGNITLSQSTDANGNTITFGDANVMSHWQNWSFAGTAALNTQQASAITRSLYIVPLTPGGLFPGNMTVSTARMLMSISGSTASMSQQHSVGVSMGVYRISGSASASTLSLMNSVGSSWTNTTLATSAAANIYNGIRWLSFHSSQWSSEPVFTKGGQYFIGHVWSFSSISFNTGAFYGGSMASGNVSGHVNVSSATNATFGIHPYAGQYSATTAALPASIHISQLSKTFNNSGYRWLEFDNLLSTH